LKVIQSVDQQNLTSKIHPRPNRLRYIGLSHAQLSHTAVTSILIGISAHISSITHVDLSHNEIDHFHDPHFFQTFLSANKTLRVLDLSHNKIDEKTLKSIHLGMVENNTMLLLPLVGNPAAQEKTMELIQMLLVRNRAEYAKNSRPDSATDCSKVMTNSSIKNSSSSEGLQSPTVTQVEAKVTSTHTSSRESTIAVAVLVDATNATPSQANSRPTNNNSIVGDVSVVNSTDGKTVKPSSSLSQDNVKIHNELMEHNPTRSRSRPLSLSLSPREQQMQRLNVFFSCPLARQDRSGTLHPLEILDYSAEREMMIQVFKEVHRDVAVHFDFATTDSLRTALTLGCKALHLSGHGEQGGLCFEDGKSGLQVLTVARLRDLLRAGGVSLQFVFVSACFSKEIGETFVAEGVQHVVCVKVDSKIQDVAAIAFTRAFYVAFLTGKSVLASFTIAQEALKSSPLVPNSVLEGDKFILLPEREHIAASQSYNTGTAITTISDSADTVSGLDEFKLHHQKIVFSNRAVSDWPPSPKHCTVGKNQTDLTTFLSRLRLPKPPPDFEGREVLMYSVIRQIHDHRLVSLVGVDGVGKSTVAVAVANYIADRELFADSIVFVRAQGITNYKSFLLNLQQSLLSCSIGDSLRSLLTPRDAVIAPEGGTPYPEEALITACLQPLSMLIVIDHIDDLLSDYQRESVSDFRCFLFQLFDQCPKIKLLVVSTDSLKMRNINNVGAGIVEFSVSVGTLTLNSSLRLFARLAPSLSTAQSKDDFINAMQPTDQQHVTYASRDASTLSQRILELFEQGHPAKIVRLACESTEQSVEQLKDTGMAIIARALTPYQSLSLSRPNLLATTPHYSAGTNSMER